MTDAHNPTITATGRCECGAVTFKTHGPLRPVVYCHCGQCRRTSGHFVAATAVAKQNLEITCDTGLKWYASSDVARRGFCQGCGSSLFWESSKDQHVSIMAGCLDLPTGLLASGHIYVDNAGDYYSIDDGLPQQAQSGFRASVPDGQ